MIPPSLEVDNQDAGVNSPPAIVAVRLNDSGELPEFPPGSILFDRGEGTLTVDLVDTDVADTLFVRMFVEYTTMNPSAPRVECTAASGTIARTAVCNTAALCLPADVEQERRMYLMAFDREPAEGGDPPFQELPPGGMSVTRFIPGKCVEPPT